MTLLLAILRYVVSISLVLYLISIPDWSVLLGFGGAEFMVLAACVVGTFVCLVFMALRWRFALLPRVDATVHFRDTYLGYLKGYFYNIILPGSIGGDVFRIQVSRELYRLTVKQGTLIVLVERSLGAVALMLFLAVGLLISSPLNFLPVVPSWVIIFVAVSGTVAALAAMNHLLPWTMPQLVGLYAISWLGQGLDLLVAVILLLWFVDGTSPAWILVAVPLAFVITMVPISLGGLGIREAVLVGVLSLYGVAVEEATLVALLIYLVKVMVALLGYAIVAVVPFSVGNQSSLVKITDSSDKSAS